MTNKELILKTIEFLKPKSGHINIVESLWEDLDLSKEKRLELRDVLIEGELVNLGMPDQWSMQLTAKAMLLKPDQLNDDGTIIPEVVIREQKSRIDELLVKNLTLQNIHLKRKIPYAMVGFLGGIISALTVFLVTKPESDGRQKMPSEIHLHLDNLKINQDSILVIRPDTMNNKTANTR